MNTQIENVISELYHDSRNDHLKMITGVAKSVFRPMQPKDFKDVYLSISYQQGQELVQIVRENGFKNIVEFGTSFGISTLFLAQGALVTGGKIITTELIESKARKAVENFTKAGVDHLIEVRVGDVMQTLQQHIEPIDLLLLDGWKNLYLPLFEMLQPNFHDNTLIYVDNADMSDTQNFLRVVRQNPMYQIKSHHDGKVALVTIK